MTLYQRLGQLAKRYNAQALLFKHGFNFSPMYRRTTARITEVSDDLLRVRIRLPISWRNRNYVGTIFGGSMAAATDPIAMVQLINLLGDDYVVWDKAGTIRFRRPAKENLYAEFTYGEAELADIRRRVAETDEITIEKETRLTDQAGTTVYAEVSKTLYVANKAFYRAKRKKASAPRSQSGASGSRSNPDD
ncbi:MAG: DUF4442 domain-containing protein [Bacteroidota bacterium]